MMMNGGLVIPAAAQLRPGDLVRVLDGGWELVEPAELTAPSAPGLTAVLSASVEGHNWLGRGCSCGELVSVMEYAPHLDNRRAAVVLAWLTERLGAADVVEAAQRAYTQMQRTRDDDPAFQGSMTAALTAAVEALTGEVERHV